MTWDSLHVSSLAVLAIRHITPITAFATIPVDFRPEDTSDALLLVWH